MKKNRIICTVLAGAVMLTSLAAMFTPVSANAAAASDKEGTYASEVETMVSLGFLKSMNTDDENAAVTKGMFIASVVELMGYGDHSYGTTSPFTDVSPSDPFYKEICTAAQLGIVNGDGSGVLNPDSLITYTTAVVILENAMGYYTDALYNGGYPGGYIKTASSIGLNKGLKLGNEDRLNVGICAKLLLNAGDTELVYTRRNGVRESTEEGDKLFWERHRISKGKGIVRANENTSIDSSAGAGKNGIVIGDMQGYIYFSNESTEYLGYNVEYYYRDDGTDNIILHMEPKNTDVIEINGEDIEDFKDQTITYDVGSKRKKEVLSKNVSVIFNGVYTIDYFLDDGTSIFNPLYGDVKLIDNNNDGKTDVISVIAYKNIVVSAVDTGNRIIYDKYSAENNLDYSDAGDAWVLTDSSGNVMNFADLKKWDIVSVAKSRNDVVLRAVVTRNTFAGKVKATSEVDGRTVITTENGQYFVTKAYAALNKMPQLGTTVTFYLDYYNNIAAIEHGGNSNNFGFLIKSYYETGQDGCTAKMMTSEGIVEEIPYAKKVKVDGDFISGSKLRTTLGAADEDSASEDYIFKVIAYKLDSSGKISYIDTVKRGANEDDNTLFRVNNYSGTYLWYARSRLLGRGPNSVCVGSDSVILKTPEQASMDDTQDYGLGSTSEFIYGVDYTVNAYSTNPDSAIPEVLHMPLVGDDASNMPRNARTCIISSINRAVNDDDEIVSVIDYYSGDTEYTSYTVEGVDTSALKEGDIIKVTFNAHDEISYINHVYSGDTLSFTPENTYSTHNEDFGTEYQPYASKLFILDNDIIGITNEINENTKISDCTFQRVMDGETAIYFVENGRKKREVTKVTSDELSTVMDYYHNGKETSLFLMTTSGISKFLVIYKLDY